MLHGGVLHSRSIGKVVGLPLHLWGIDLFKRLGDACGGLYLLMRTQQGGEGCIGQES